MKHLRLAAFVSGSGSNLQSIIDAIYSDELDARIVQVIASKENIPAAERAKLYDLPYATFPRKNYAGNVVAMCQDIAEYLEPLHVDLILLCGYLSFLSERFVDLYQGRIMNIHPSLLPAFGGHGAYGMRVHQSVLDHGAKVSGCTVMFVDAGADSGPIILQRAVPVCENDSPNTLAVRVMTEENIAYPAAVKLFGEGRLQIEGKRVHILDPYVP